VERTLKASAGTGALKASVRSGALGRACTSALCALALACGGDDHRQTLELDVAPIVADLGADDLDVRERAVERLVAIGPPVLPALQAALRDEPPAVRLGAVEVLGAFETSEVAATLAEVAEHDPDADVRYEALVTLGGRDDVAAARAALHAMADEQANVVLGGIGACAVACRDAEGFGRLVELALHAPLPNGLVARSTIGKLLLDDRDPARSAILRTAVTDRVPLLLDAATPPDVRLRAALLASDLGDPAALDALLAWVPEAGGALRAHVVWGLGQVGDARAVPILVELAPTPISPYAYDALRRIAARGVPEAQTAQAAWKGPKPSAAMPAPYALF